MPDIFISPEKKSHKEKKSKTEKKEFLPPPVEDTSLNLDPTKRAKIEKTPGHTHNPLSAYCYMPDSVNFENRNQEEQVILLLRKHPITNVGWILIFLLMFVAPVVLTSFPILDFFPVNFRFIAILGWYLITFAYALESFLTWFFNVYIITDERIVDIDFHNLIYKEISDANIDRIQDVTYKMGGVIRTVLNYGDVYIQTASEVPAFEFLAVPRPDRVTKVLQDLRIQEEQEKIEGRVR